MAQIRELAIAFGKAKQADIETANVLGGLWRLNKVNTQMASVPYVVEDDGDELGKGHEFIANQYKSHVEGGPHTLEKYLSSEFAAWLWAYGLGNVAKTGSGPYVYTCTPLDRPTDGDELPYFSYIETIRQGGSAVRDLMLVGCAVRSFQIRLNSGVGRQNAMATVEFAHSGLVTEPSGITIPAATSENPLNSYSAAITINGVDYITAKTFMSLEMGWDNGASDETDYRPGSGQQDGFQVRDTIEVGDRVPSFSFQAQYKNGSAELAKVTALTSGEATVVLTKDSNNIMDVTWHDVGFSVAEVGESGGKTVVNVTGIPKYDSSNGVVTAVCTTSVDGICQ